MRITEREGKLKRLKAGATFSQPKMSRRRPLREAEDTQLVCERKNGVRSGKVQDVSWTEPVNPLWWLAIPWHAGMIIFYSLLLYHGTNLMNSNAHILDPLKKIPDFGGRFKFLTHINQWLQLAFFCVQLLADVVPMPFNRRLRMISDWIFTTVVIPVTSIVITVFWGLYSIDRKLIYPEVFDIFVPAYMNHFWHTTILLWVLCEIYLVHHQHPSPAMAASSVFMVGSAYIAWIVYIYVRTQFWVYPFMKHLPEYGLALFFGSCLFFTFGLYLLGKWVTYLRWGRITYMNSF